MWLQNHMQAPRMAEDGKPTKSSRLAEKENGVITNGQRPRYATVGDDELEVVRRSGAEGSHRSTDPAAVRKRLDRQRAQWDSQMREVRASLKKVREEGTKPFNPLEERQRKYEKRKEQREREKRTVVSMPIDVCLSVCLSVCRSVGRSVGQSVRYRRSSATNKCDA